MENEKLELYKKNMLKAKKERENNTGVKSPIAQLETNIKTVTSNIKQFIDIADKEHICKVKGEDVTVPSIEVLNRDMLSDILGLKDMYKESLDAFKSGVLSSKQLSGRISNIHARVNLSLRKANMSIQAISHEKNQYRILVEIPKKFFE